MFYYHLLVLLTRYRLLLHWLPLVVCCCCCRRREALCAGEREREKVRAPNCLWHTLAKLSTHIKATCENERASCTTVMAQRARKSERVKQFGSGQLALLLLLVMLLRDSARISHQGWGDRTTNKYAGWLAEKAKQNKRVKRTFCH